jgi:hypothetical protein
MKAGVELTEELVAATGAGAGGGVDADVVVASVELDEVLLCTVVATAFAVGACVEVALVALSLFADVVVFALGEQVGAGRGRWPWHISHSFTKPWLIKVHTCEAG